MTLNDKRAELAKRLAMADYDLIAAAAVGGERCPLTIPYGPVRQNSLEWLTKNGLVRTELYRHNYRKVTILTGEHAGRSTAPPPDETLKPWLTIDANGRYKAGKEVPLVTRRIFAPEQLPEEPYRAPWSRERPQPSKPRSLTREEISKL